MNFNLNLTIDIRNELSDLETSHFHVSHLYFHQNSVLAQKCAYRRGRAPLIPFVEACSSFQKFARFSRALAGGGLLTTLPPLGDEKRVVTKLENKSR